MFSEIDLVQIEARGSQLAKVEEQVRNFETGFPFLKIIKAATPGEGLILLEEEEANRYAQAYEQESKKQEVVKFVPASGAASRMFKDLFSFLETYDGSEAAFQQFKGEGKTNPVFTFFERIADFAFYADLAASMGGGTQLVQALAQQQLGLILEHLLTEKGLNYGSLPKGLLKFHRYEGEDRKSRTPAEEHLVEGARYAADESGAVRIHFTVSPDHRVKFEQLIKEVRAIYQNRFGVTFDISFSVQKPFTDTIAVDMNNKPFREKDESILFRPAGHGALLSNLNDLDADILFVKNIDNVVPDRIKKETIRYKKALAGLLLAYQRRIFNYLEALNSHSDDSLIKEVESFLEQELNCLPPAAYSDWDAASRRAYLLKKLNRPMRVCGMVKNEGEPGGGPFWAQNPDGSVSLQIAESAQIDFDDPAQAKLVQNATHFNPVDLICATRDHQGKSFDLMKFRDPQTGFISEKSKDGRELKAQELPGLWNGAMSDWITLFAEVPIITFNPVKTVNDLLRDQHQ